MVISAQAPPGGWGLSWLTAALWGTADPVRTFPSPLDLTPNGLVDAERSLFDNGGSETVS